MTNPSNLPSGCTDNDVDPPMVECPECEGHSDGKEWFNPETGYIERCRTCDGTGEVRKDSVQE